MTTEKPIFLHFVFFNSSIVRKAWSKPLSVPRFLSFNAGNPSTLTRIRMLGYLLARATIVSVL